MVRKKSTLQQTLMADLGSSDSSDEEEWVPDTDFMRSKAESRPVWASVTRARSFSSSDEDIFDDAEFGCSPNYSTPIIPATDCGYPECCVKANSTGRCERHGKTCSQKGCSKFVLRDEKCFKHCGLSLRLFPECVNLVRNGVACFKHVWKTKLSSPDRKQSGISMVSPVGDGNQLRLATSANKFQKCTGEFGTGIGNPIVISEDHESICSHPRCSTLAKLNGKCKIHGGSSKCLQRGCAKYAFIKGKWMKHSRSAAQSRQQSIVRFLEKVPDIHHSDSKCIDRQVKSSVIYELVEQLEPKVEPINPHPQPNASSQMQPTTDRTFIPVAGTFTLASTTFSSSSALLRGPACYLHQGSIPEKLSSNMEQSAAPNPREVRRIGPSYTWLVPAASPSIAFRVPTPRQTCSQAGCGNVLMEQAAVMRTVEAGHVCILPASTLPTGTDSVEAIAKSLDQLKHKTTTMSWLENGGINASQQKNEVKFRIESCQD